MRLELFGAVSKEKTYYLSIYIYIYMQRLGKDGQKKEQRIVE